MKKLILIAMMMLGMATTAWATPYDLTLGQVNLNFSGTDLAGYGGGFGEVTIDAGGHVIFQGITDLLYNGHTFDIWFTTAGLNVGSGTTTPTNMTPNPAAQQGGTGNIDGFGTFNVQVTTGNGAPNAVPTIAFDLTGGVTLTPNNSPQGNLAAAHIVIFEDGLIGALTTGDAANGTPVPPVPEPGTLLLLGGGLLGLAVYGRKRMKR
jgi:hypothetical protein